MNRSVIIRANESFKKEIEDVIAGRIINGKDRINDKKSSNRITLGIIRHPLWSEKIKKDLTNADMPNKEGSRK